MHKKVTLKPTKEKSILRRHPWVFSGAIKNIEQGIINGDIVEIINNNHISIRVWERGAGETLSCGTGACAAAVISMIWDLARSPVLVSTRGGQLTVNWSNQSQNLLLTGPARQVFCGEISI